MEVLGWAWSKVKVGVSFPCTSCSNRRKPSSFTYTPARTRAGGKKDWGVGCNTSEEKSGKARSKQVRQTRAAKADEH